jgi:hypothetical protein
MSHNSAFHRTAAAQRGPLTLVPLPPGMAPTVDAVVPDAAFKPSVDDGGVFHVTFAAGRVPPAPVALTVRIGTWVPEPGKTCADLSVVKATLTGALQLTRDQPDQRGRGDAHDDVTRSPAPALAPGQASRRTWPPDWLPIYRRV